MRAVQNKNTNQKTHIADKNVLQEQKKQNKLLSQISVPSDKNPLIQKALENINSDEEILTMWEVINVNAIDRMGMTDHGIVHFQIVANIGLKLLRTLQKNGIKSSVEKDYELSSNHAELITILGCLFHDLGMTINRGNHEEFSLIIAERKLHGVLDFLPVKERVIVASEVLHSIISHRKGGEPLTLEAGVVRVADALDMAEGRSRVTYEVGNVDIHSLSHAAIQSVSIDEGQEKPVEIEIVMTNSAGLFQVDELLKKKIKGSGLEKYVRVRAVVEQENEKKLLHEIKIDL